MVLQQALSPGEEEESTHWCRHMCIACGREEDKGSGGEAVPELYKVGLVGLHGDVCSMPAGGEGCFESQIRSGCLT